MPSPFDTCCSCFNEYMNRPLGGMVLVSLWLAAIEVFCVIVAIMNSEEIKACEFPSGLPKDIGIKTWLYVQAVFSIVNFLFAPYLQNKLWVRLLDEAKEADSPGKGPSDRTLEAQKAKGAIKASQHDLQHAFMSPDMMVYALIVLLSFTWSLLGWLWILRMGPWTPPEGHERHEETTQIDCNPGAFGEAFGAPAWAARTGMFYFVFLVVFMFAWILSIALMGDNETLVLRKRLPGYEEVSQDDDGNQQSGGFFSNWGSSPVTPPDNNEPAPTSKMRQAGKLVASVGVDFLGMSSYAMPGVGEVGDVVFAPASAVALKMMYNANGIAAVGLIEELLPGTDVVPTATIAWTLETFMPNSRLTRGLGINPNSWNLTGSTQR